MPKKPNLSNFNRQPSAPAVALRALVDPSAKGGDRLPECVCLTELSDDQLIRIVQWIKEGRPNEFVARNIKDLWGKCFDVPWLSLLEAVSVLRKTTMTGTEPVHESVELLFDPLAENASLIVDLQTERRRLVAAIDKAIADKRPPDQIEPLTTRCDRLAKIIREAIADHSRMAAQKAETQQAAAAAAGPRRGVSPVNIGHANIIFNAFQSVGEPGQMGDFLEIVASKIEQIDSSGNPPAGKRKNASRSRKPTGSA